MKPRRPEIGGPASRRVLYVLAGLVLAAGAPLGLLILRAWLAGVVPTVTWVESQLQADPVPYLYQGVATAIVFTSIGFIVGGFEDRLERLSSLDGLTGLLNRSSFNRLVDTEIARAHRYHKPLSFLLVDVDDFKRINDQYGHPAGDAALRGIADCLRANCRVSDVAARYGGDEFAVLLTETGGEDAERFAERLLTLLHSAPPFMQAIRLPSVSIGLAELHPDDAYQLHLLVTRADDALYAAKRAGRNCTSIAPPPPPAP